MNPEEAGRRESIAGIADNASCAAHVPEIQATSLCLGSELYGEYREHCHTTTR
jgi:hypothetical protein